MNQLWEDLARDIEGVKIKRYSTKGASELKKAGVVAFGDNFTLVAARELLEEAANGETDRANIPPTDEELEANFAATFFQCGIALLDQNADALRLAHRAFTDVNYVRKALKMCRSPEFLEEFARLESIDRAIL